MNVTFTISEFSWIRTFVAVNNEEEYNAIAALQPIDGHGTFVITPRIWHIIKNAADTADTDFLSTESAFILRSIKAKLNNLALPISVEEALANAGKDGSS